MIKVLVTGANGLLGTNTVLELLKQGFIVNALVRKKSSFIKYSHPNLHLIEGDITDYDSLNQAVKGCEFVIHTAALTAQNFLKYSDYHEVNINGTKNIIKICKQNNVKRLVYVGTANTFGYGSLENLGNENLKMKEPYLSALYALSKLEAQELIDSSSDSIDIVTISPTFMLGAYDSKPSSGKIILMAMNKKILFYPLGGKNFVHVNDVAKGIVKALKTGIRGECYIFANENISYKDFFKLVCKTNNNKPLLVKLPKLILLVVVFIGDVLRFSGVKTEVSSVNMKILCINNYYSNQKAANTFNMHFQSTQKAISDSLIWFKKENKIKA